ncbi:hydroxymethylglutaryl-CoA lyase [Sphingobacterium sp. SRCM116780]|uniref:hydroxymethylglutaryl-CoA lyase n=1 Tax=Sphingobacterium sp. SRCM116780 TaxID=2907623 RepID=UPI001F435415|nr:hydroxymethylglutaryl-CoA lyase [Sphingobacterium sp. SRCM116780]UIR57934.1 hydroxymethylglutaryl-CoA lyase [Sphingobacterium sp. SRCM116780]
MPKDQDIILVECPRDAIQGISPFIPTEKKVKYLNMLLESKLFDWLDFGSFVSPKAVPQLADTEEVLSQLVLNDKTKLLSIIANEQGALRAVQSEKITFLGYPFSISETFQQRNTNASIAASFERLQRIVEIAHAHQKQMVVYISMAFGNPFGDAWSEGLVLEWIDKIAALGVIEFSLADTTSEATLPQITQLFEQAISKFPSLHIGAHFHSPKASSLEKINAAYLAGCRKFDGAILGYGGCPFAEDELVGNIPTEDLLYYFERDGQNKILAIGNEFIKLIS